MATVNSDVLRFIFSGLRTDFVEAYRRRMESAVYPTIATIVETTLPHQDYAQLSANPTMRQWIGERAKKSKAQLFPTYTVTDATWEDTLTIQRRTIEDDQYSKIRQDAMFLGAEPVRHKEQLVVQALGAGGSVAGMDSAAGSFASTTHNESGTNQSNTMSGALTPANLQTAISKMRLFTDSQGVPLGINPTHILVGPNNEFNVDQIIHSSLIVSGNTTAAGNKNPLVNRLIPIVSPYFNGSYANYWAVMDLSLPVKPVILQERSDVPVEFIAQENPELDSVFLKDEFNYGLRARYQVGYGLWQTLFLGTN